VNEKHDNRPSEVITLDAIYFMLFRQKWTIISFSLAGLLIAFLIYALKPPLYSSEAELLIRYVEDSRLPAQPGNPTQIKVPDLRGENIMNSEVQILTSLDLAKDVVNAIGAEKVLAKVGGGTNVMSAAGLVKKNIGVEPIRRSDVIQVGFRHPDKEVVQPILTQLIASYLKRHAEIHRDLGVSDDFLIQRTTALSNQLGQTEEQLRNAKLTAGVVSLDYSRKEIGEEITKLHDEILDAEVQLAEHKAALKEMTNVSFGDSGGTNNATSDVPSELIDDYKRVATQLILLARKEQELLTQFTANSVPVREVHRQMTEAVQFKKNLEEKYPALANVSVTVPGMVTQPQGTAPYAPNEAVQVKVLTSKIEVLNSQLREVQARADKVTLMEGTIVELQRQRDLQEAEYRYFSSSLEQARFNVALEAGKLSNISITQEPTPPIRDVMGLFKLLAMIIVGGVVGGIGIGFVFEFYLDRTFKRPIEVETRLQMPLYLSIPESTRNGSPSGIGGDQQRRLLNAPGNSGAAETAGQAGKGEAKVVPWDANHQLRLFFEALRDRLVTDFEVNNLRHKPKLIAVTACAHGAGVSTIATGLAATLSETGDGNVLLVDMNSAQGAAHPFYRGKPTCRLADALEDQKRNGAMVQENLYVVSEGNSGKELLNIPKYVAQLMPRLRASDYDHIIFDLPPVSQTSVTNKLSQLMDINLLVVESEKTNRDVVKRASSMLSGSKGKVGVVLNKTRNYVPQWLVQEL
jgi:polysaccharide biosynthesis transport protein